MQQNRPVRGVPVAWLASRKYRVLGLLALSFVPARLASAQQFCAGASAIDSVPYYIGQLYGDILKRPPDTAGQIFHITTLESLNSTNCNSADPTLAAGSCEWTNYGQTAYDFLTSAESVGINGSLSSNDDFVTALYELLLRRAPDNVGFNYWVSALKSGISRTDVVSMFVSSPEYRKRFACTYNGHATPLCNGAESIDPIPTMVSQLYLDILNRPSDGLGYAWWTSYTSNNLRNMCRNTSGSTYSVCDHVMEAQTVLQFFNSTEYANFNPSIRDNGAFVTALYNHLLQRPPDQPGLAFYTNYLNQTNDRLGTIQSFRTSDEYRQRFSCYAGQNSQLNFGVNGHPFSHVEYSNTSGVTYGAQIGLQQGLKQVLETSSQAMTVVNIKGTKSGAYYIVDVEVEGPGNMTLDTFDIIKKNVTAGVKEGVKGVKIVRVFANSRNEGGQ